MQLHIDYNPSPKDHFFISAELNAKTVISFDNTIKGHRLIKQVHIGNKPFPKAAKFDSEWNTIIIENGKFIKEYHVRWIDQDKLDWLDGELWETVWEKPLSASLTKKLLRFSQLISDNYKNLDKVSNQVKAFERLVKKEIKEYI